MERVWDGGNVINLNDFELERLQEPTLEPLQHFVRRPRPALECKPDEYSYLTPDLEIYLANDRLGRLLLMKRVDNRESDCCHGSGTWAGSISNDKTNMASENAANDPLTLPPVSVTCNSREWLLSNKTQRRL